MAENSEDTFVTRSHCPLCGSELVTHWQSFDIPFFGDVMNVSTVCTCGFRFADTLVLSQREPVRYELLVQSTDDLNARVVRSTSGTIRIPELGIDIEPGAASESFVSNIEGVLDRVRDVLKGVLCWDSPEDAEKRENAKALLSRIDDVVEGNEEISVIIEDPLGNSAIISDRASRTFLSPEEARMLRTGEIVFEKA
ncbi:MAG TPA: ZPR1 zinc finger domain-containing protein [Candidatus Methanoperedenaceae archaeon]|nr:ZPR1 zinc finger domain-containing protein [Candidatus Methanoperedenaceae archaeon]